MAKTEGTYIQVAYKNVFGYISTNSWPFFMIQRPTVREKCAWVRSNTWRDERPVATGLDRFFFGFSIFRQTSQLATEKIQNLCNRNWWSGLLQLGSVQFWSFFPVQQTGPANTRFRQWWWFRWCSMSLPVGPPIICKIRPFRISWEIQRVEIPGKLSRPTFWFDFPLVSCLKRSDKTSY